MRLIADTTLLRLADRPHAEADLYCFPHGGGGPSVYRGWADHLPAFVEPYALALPGREHRSSEPPATDPHEVVERVVAAILRSSRPYALFGHSSGSAFAAQVASELHRRGAAPPVLLGVSAFPAPHLTRRCDLIRHLFRNDLEGTVRLLDPQAAGAFTDPAVRAHALAAVAADVAFHSGYRYPPEILTCPIATFCGDADPVLEPAEMGEWAALTRAAVTHHTYPGDHFYLRDQRAPLVADLTWALSAALP